MEPSGPRQKEKWDDEEEAREKMAIFTGVIIRLTWSQYALDTRRRNRNCENNKKA